ncbi:MAG: GNAT family N-acetyltransferase, partial [Verrucomicrobiae bacterium]|nr:GNAT family N-acetyltransferase [Verrucomicrobiae bacterium]
QAVQEFLGDKHDLGIHTEMLVDSIVDLIEKGVITGANKSTDRGKIVVSFCMGTRKLYDYIHNNDIFAFHPTEYVNDPYIISQQHKMTAINVALEIDLTGQVCADSLGNKFYSGIGGQVDFNRGAARAINGKAIIAMPSTARDGTVSRIVAHLTPGAGVVTTRGDVHYIVTEHGVAYLHGKNVEERALALISIAHPDFRAQLLRDAIEAKYVRKELTAVQDRVSAPTQALRSSLLLDDGTLVSFREVRITDEAGIKDLAYALSRQSLYFRFMRTMKWIPQKQIQDFVFVDHRIEVAIVGTVPEAYGENIIALGGYYLDLTTNRAEVAFIVEDGWQNRGIGSHMMSSLINIAKRQGIAGFTAEVLLENKGMQSVFNNSECKTKCTLKQGVYSYQMDFT